MRQTTLSGIEQDLPDAMGAAGGRRRHRAANYGNRATQVAQLARDNPDTAGRLLPAYPYLRAEVVYAIRLEMACTLRDVLARRIRMEITDWAYPGSGARSNPADGRN
ncbi:MAG: hypothetical protein IPM81_11955 [Saprospirales bacterium]|nr:hypothetical protein [Saprospirales bacterium]